MGAGDGGEARQENLLRERVLTNLKVADFSHVLSLFSDLFHLFAYAFPLFSDFLIVSAVFRDIFIGLSRISAYSCSSLFRRSASGLQAKAWDRKALTRPARGDRRSPG